MSIESESEHFMGAALAEAAKGLGQTSPNPSVGAVLVLNGEIIAKGHHRRAGTVHAEIACLRSFEGPVPKEATLYVTLEPCSTTGRTPPCTRAIGEKGVRNVIVGATDPNPRHAGRGIEILRQSGITVRSNVLAKECAAINEGFNKWIQTKRPFVIAKCGMSLDGRLTTPPRAGRWITSSAARRHANGLRAQVDAIMIGAETLRRDNPRLTVRGIRGARQPWRVVLTRSAQLPGTSHLFTDRFADRTVIFRNKTLSAALAELGKREITSVLIEGGGDLLGQALDGRLVDRVQIYLGPVLTGGPVIAFPGRGAGSTTEALRLRDVRYEKIEHDVFLSARATDESSAPE